MIKVCFPLHICVGVKVLVCLRSEDLQIMVHTLKIANLLQTLKLFHHQRHFLMLVSLGLLDELNV